MRIFKCSICGFIFDEAVGMPDKDIVPGTKWEDISDEFSCPLCGAPKIAFEEIQEQQSITAAPVVIENDAEFEDLRELSAGELSVVCSNLAKGCEKQHLTEEVDLFNQLADYYKSRASVQKGKMFDDAKHLLNTDLVEHYAKSNTAASSKADRGALRALVWSEKVSRMINSLLDRYSREGNALLENTKIYVCDICGFVYLGNNLPEICPVCKVPNYKISQIERR